MFAEDIKKLTKEALASGKDDDISVFTDSVK